MKTDPSLRKSHGAKSSLKSLLRNGAASCALLAAGLAWADAGPGQSLRTPAPSWDWTGFYAGVHGGGGWGATDWRAATGPLGAFSTDTFAGSGIADGTLAGVQIGFNRQIGRWVAGAEIDASWSDLNGYSKCAIQLAPPDSFNCHASIAALGTFTGRLGWSADRLLVYGKAGAAWASVRHEANHVNLPMPLADEGIHWGYTLGAGVEYAFSPAWSGRFEYNFVDLGGHTASLGDRFGNRSDVTLRQNLHLFKFGLNHAIGARPRPPARRASHPGSSSDWMIEAGTRIWFNDGKMQKDLFNSIMPALLNSRLIYAGMSGYSVEGFARVDHRSGWFAKGTLGFGSLPNGTLNDEDFPPAISHYSNTLHGLARNTLRFGNLDVGYNVIHGPAGRLGAFAGYRHVYQRGNGYGCTQLAAPVICPVPLSDSNLLLSETEHWSGVAVGVNARLALTGRLGLDVEAAYLPYVDHDAMDNHWRRSDINPMAEPGHGWGTQVEAVLSYAVTQRLSLGLGARYWFFTTTEGSVLFPGAAMRSPLTSSAERYGGFLQASYRIGGADRPEPEVDERPPMDWSGVYAGIHFGAGSGRNDWSSPMPPVPTGDRVLTGGAIGGAQVGVDHQVGRFVIGAELSGAWGRIEGTETCFAGAPVAIGGINCGNAVDSVTTLTGRLGAAWGQSLIYARAGAAMVRQTRALNTSLFLDGGQFSRRSVDWGWTAGGGLEHALTPQWSVNAEYRYVDLGSSPNGVPVPAVYPPTANELVSSRLHLFSLGVNRRFSLK